MGERGAPGIRFGLDGRRVGLERSCIARQVDHGAPRYAECVLSGTPNNSSGRCAALRPRLSLYSRHFAGPQNGQRCSSAFAEKRRTSEGLGLGLSCGVRLRSRNFSRPLGPVSFLEGPRNVAPVFFWFPFQADLEKGGTDSKAPPPSPPHWLEDL